MKWLREIHVTNGQTVKSKVCKQMLNRQSYFIYLYSKTVLNILDWRYTSMLLFIMKEKKFSTDICDFKGQTYITSFIKVDKLVNSSDSVLGKAADKENLNWVKLVDLIHC